MLALRLDCRQDWDPQRVAVRPVPIVRKTSQTFLFRLPSLESPFLPALSLTSEPILLPVASLEAVVSGE